MNFKGNELTRSHPVKHVARPSIQNCMESEKTSRGSKKLEKEALLEQTLLEKRIDDKPWRDSHGSPTGLRKRWLGTWKDRRALGNYGSCHTANPRLAGKRKKHLYRTYLELKIRNESTASFLLHYILTNYKSLVLTFSSHVYQSLPANQSLLTTEASSDRREARRRAARIVSSPYVANFMAVIVTRRGCRW